MSKLTVLITSATGRIGKELVALLSNYDAFTVRACYFSEVKADDLMKLGADEVEKVDKALKKQIVAAVDPKYLGSSVYSHVTQIHKLWRCHP